jgi:hypothetical protein
MDNRGIDCEEGMWIQLPQGGLCGAIAQGVGRRLLTAATQAQSAAVHMGFVVDKGAMGRISLNT